MPNALNALDSVNACSPSIPESTLLAAVSDPQIVTNDPALPEAALSRGTCLMEHLPGPVQQLDPHVKQLLALGGSLQGLLIELDSLTAAASSDTAAIQLEHMQELLDEEGQAKRQGQGEG